MVLQGSPRPWQPSTPVEQYSALLQCISPRAPLPTCPVCILRLNPIPPLPTNLPPTVNPPSLTSDLTCSHTLAHTGVLCPRHLLRNGPHEDMQDEVINWKGPYLHPEIEGETNKLGSDTLMTNVTTAISSGWHGEETLTRRGVWRINPLC